MTTLVLLPGMHGTGPLFSPFLDALPPNLRTRVVSYPTHEPLAYSELKSIACRDIPSGGSVVLLGESFSGPIAVSIAAKLGSQVQGLVLCCTFIRNPRPALSPLRPLTSIFPFGLMPTSAIAKILLGSFATPELRRLLGEAFQPVSPAALRTRLREIMTVDESRALASVRCPVLYLRATHDVLVPMAAWQEVLRHSPNARLVELRGPHCLLQAAPYEAAREVVTFIRGLENAAQPFH